MLVKNLMTEDVVTAEVETTIPEIAKLLNKHRVHGIPITENNRVVGIITESDFFLKELPGVHLPSYLDFLKKIGYPHKIPQMYLEDVNKLLKIKAKDIMTKNEISIDPQADIGELINIFIKKKISTVPVIDKNDSLVGIITRADIIRIFKQK